MTRMTCIVFLVVATAAAQASAQGLAGRPGVPPADVPGVPRVGPRQPLAPFPGGGPLGHRPGIGLGAPNAGPGLGPQWPMLPPNRPLPGIGLRGPDQDDDHKRGRLDLPSVHFGHIPAFERAEAGAARVEGFNAYAEARPAFRSANVVNETGRGFGKWFGGALAGLGAVITGAFRAAFGTRSKEH